MVLATGAGILTPLLAQMPAQAQTAQDLQNQIEALNQQLQQLQQQQQRQLLEQLNAATEDPIIPDGVARSGNDDVSFGGLRPG